MPTASASPMALHRAFDAAFAVTRLPARPDYAAANAFLVRARRTLVSGGALPAAVYAGTAGTDVALSVGLAPSDAGKMGEASEETPST